MSVLELGIQNSLYAELVGFIMAIEIAYRKCWHMLGLDYDSMLAVNAFSSSSFVPRRLINRWKICVDCRAGKENKF